MQCAFGHVRLLRSSYKVSAESFAEMYQNSEITVVLGSYVAHTDGFRKWEMFCGDAHWLKPELNSENEELFLTIFHSIKDG